MIDNAIFIYYWLICDYFLKACNPMKLNRLLFICLVSVAFVGLEGEFTPKAYAEEGAFRIGSGYYDAFDSFDAVELHAEYHMGERFYDLIRPFAGVMVTSDEAAYGYAGARFEFDVDDSWQIAPAFAAGAYRDGDGKELGHTVEFRSAFEVNYKITDNGRVGASIYHLSNASLDDVNPGTEVVNLHYTHSLY